LLVDGYTPDRHGDRDAEYILSERLGGADRLGLVTLPGSAACRDVQRRRIVALSRFAGLRCPSEVIGFRWGDADWERGRLTVRSPKPASHEGHGVRVVPIAPELLTNLHSLFDRAEPGTDAVIPRLRDPAMNMRTTFGKIIAKAGGTPWPRLFHTMRASCACDWVERFPAHVVAQWPGHSPLVASRHHLQTRDAHFEMAIGGLGGTGNGEPEPIRQHTRTEAIPRTNRPRHKAPKTLRLCGVWCRV